MVKPFFILLLSRYTLMYLSEKHIEDSKRFDFYTNEIEDKSQCCLFNNYKKMPCNVHDLQDNFQIILDN
jgi:hypothetical protein